MYYSFYIGLLAALPFIIFTKMRGIEMSNPIHHEIALYYCVDDLPGANILGARLQTILSHVRSGKPLTRLSLSFLKEQGLASLHQLVTGTLAYEDFRKAALAEQAIRVKKAATVRLAQEIEENLRKAVLREKARLHIEKMEAARLAREKDPQYVARARNMELRKRYGIHDFIEKDCFGRLMKILNALDIGKRLTKEDFVWIASVGKKYFTVKIQEAYHLLEADFFAGEFKNNGDLWAAVNASSHYRKCRRASIARGLLSSIDLEQQKSRKLHTALCTTYGGVMRDLAQPIEALRLGEKAHGLMPTDYRPCTLLGAVHMETGNYDLGKRWYDEALKRGASVDDVDQEIRNIFVRADHVKQEEMRVFLLRDDPVRYRWAAAKTKPRKTRLKGGENNPT